MQKNESEENQRLFGARLLIARGDVARTQVDDAGAAPALGEGQARFRVERVALTANNVTYALLGDRMGYWRFFPAPTGWGCVPTWGFGVCVESAADGLSVGERFYGYWPLAEQLVVETASVSEAGFTDPSAHRQGLADLYNRYERRAQTSPEAEAIEALFRPLFMTGWLIAQTLELREDDGASQIVLSSASAKTSIGVAWTHARREGPRATLVGLTSTRNVAFVEGLGLYDRVFAYEQLDALDPQVSTSFVDIAGDRTLRARVHERFGPNLLASTAVGIAHGAPDETQAVPGVESQFFFAPQAIGALSQAFGRAELGQRMMGAWARFANDAGELVTIERRDGIEAGAAAFDALARGDVGGATSLVVELPGGA